MVSLRNYALAALLCLPLCFVRAASAQGNPNLGQIVAFGVTASVTNPCPPHVPCLMMCGFPPPIDFEPNPDNLVLLTPNGKASGRYLEQTVLATNSGVVTGLIFKATNAVGPGIRAIPTLEQVTIRFDYADPFVFSTDIPGYNVTGEDLGAVRLVTLTAEPGTQILLGSPVLDANGKPTFENWNLELMNPNDTTIPPAFFSSTLTAQGFGVAQTPEPGALALLGGLVALSGAAWRRSGKKRSRI